MWRLPLHKPYAKLIESPIADINNSGKDRFAGAISDAGLSRLRACESGGNYSAVSRNGLYRGAYQFSRRTWSNVAKNVLPTFASVDPAAAPPHVQDAMARALWAATGPRSWPVCGYRAR